MHEIYRVVSGPLVWAAFGIFLFGSLYRLISLALLARKRDAVVFSYMDLGFALRSIFHWIIPFASTNWRKKPAMTVFTFAFHISLLAAPIFLFAHVSMVREAFGVWWPVLPDGACDVMAVVVVVSCLFFLARRLMLPEVQYLTSASDYGILLLVAVPFISGFWAYHLLPGAKVATIVHMLSGEVLLAAIPFTRLAHMLFALFTRAYIGSEFGAVRHARDW